MKKPQERLQKILAHAGIASRRKAEEYITTGRVSVNGKIVTELGTKADPESDHIKVDGRLLNKARDLVYLAVNKPRGVMTTMSDPEGRRTVTSLLKRVKTRVYPVGRLDYNSEGLLLMTNDGDFAAKVMDPATHLEKIYHVKVNGPITAEQEAKFRTGIPVHGRRTKPAEIRCIKRAKNPWYEVKLTEGRTNQIRLMFQHLGRLVEKLRRTQVGFLELGALEVGKHRPLTDKEVARFRRLLKLN